MFIAEFTCIFPPLDHTQMQLNLAHSFKTFFTKISFNIILTFLLFLQKSHLYIGFPIKILYVYFIRTTYTTWSTHHPPFDHPHYIRWRVKIWPAPVAAQSKLRMVLNHSNTGIIGSNPARGMDVCPCFVVLCCLV